ncbi:S-methyl-5'-thioadenosine phosphorylase [Bacteroidota bacterium]
MKRIALIGGSGLENPELLLASDTIMINTPYGVTEPAFKIGQIDDTEIVLISRHGKKHTIPPAQVNNRANIYAIKELQCSHILATTACGSLREEIRPGDFVFPDQFIDFTKHRISTFYEGFDPDKPNHVSMPDPFDATLREQLAQTAERLKLPFHNGGTVITIEGPRFSTRAESHMFRSWGADIINMSTAPEAALANELGIPYAAIAMSTDYDCWKDNEEPVTWEAVLATFRQNVENVIQLLRAVIPAI